LGFPDWPGLKGFKPSVRDIVSTLFWTYNRKGPVLADLKFLLAFPALGSPSRLLAVNKVNVVTKLGIMQIFPLAYNR